MVDNVAYASLAADGTLAYRLPGNTVEGKLVAVTRQGAISEPDPTWRVDFTPYLVFWQVSPDGSRLAIANRVNGNQDVWVKELPDGPFRRMTSSPEPERDPHWSADGLTITYLSRALGDYDIWRLSAAGGGEPELVYQHENVGLTQVVPVPGSERYLIRTSGTVGRSRDLYEVDLASHDTAKALLASPFEEMAPALSPDGRWLAYVSDRSGRDEVFVRPYPNVMSYEIQISVEGGWGPRWSRDGSELFFVADPEGSEPTMTAAKIDAGGQIPTVSRERLFRVGPDLYSLAESGFFDVDAEGRFWMLRLTSRPDVVVVFNFHEELERLVPN